MKVHLRILSLSVLAAAALFCSCKGTGSGKSSYQTVTVSPGSLSTTVTATGTIEPINQVEVGAQVSGIISNIYVDYNTVVKQGQLMAEIDRLAARSRTGILAGFARFLTLGIRIPAEEFRPSEGLVGKETHFRYRIRAGEVQLRKIPQFVFQIQSGHNKGGKELGLLVYLFSYRRGGAFPRGGGRSDGSLKF